MTTTVFKPGGAFGPGETPATLREVALRDLHVAGLVHEINRKVLYDLGMMLVLERAPGADGSNSDRYVRLYVLETFPPERIVDVDDSGAAWERFQRWLSARVGTIRR